MTTTHRWSAYGSIQTPFTTELNALGNNNHAISAAVDMTSTPNMYLDIELYLASVDLSAQVNPAIYIWLLARTDGTNFEDGSSGTPGTNPARQPDAIIPLRAVNAAQRIFSRLILTTPDQFKILFKNVAGAALAGTSNTLKYYIYTDTMV